MAERLPVGVLPRLRRPLEMLYDLVESVRSTRYPRDYHIAGGFQRIYLYHIRKTGGTSLNQMFLALSGVDGEGAYDRLARARHLRLGVEAKVYVGWNKRLIERGRYFYAFSHLPAHKLTLPERTFTITCLRDPVARALSLYRMLVEYRDKDIPHPMMARQGQWLGNTLGDFMERVPRAHLQRQLFMFSETFSPTEAFDRIMACSHVFFVEDFAAGVESLSARLGLRLQPVHAKRSAQPVSVNPAELDQLRQRLEPEYALCALVRQELQRN